jgi:hypothetical protein
MAGTESDALADGYSALKAGLAEEAREIFAAAVSDHGSAEAYEGLIPTCGDHDRWAQSRRPMDMMAQGCSMSLFHA